MRIKKSYLITSVLLSFVSCDLSVLDKTKDVLSEMRAILETDAVKDVASGKAGFTVVSETKTGSVGVSKTQGEAGFDNSTVVGEGSSSIATGSSQGSANTAGEGSVVEDETGNDKGMSFVESGSGGIQQVDYNSGDVSVTYGGESEVVEDSYSSGTSGVIFGGNSAVIIEEDTKADYLDYLTTKAEKEESKKYNSHIYKTKSHMEYARVLASKITKSYSLFNLYNTKGYGTQNLGETRVREIAAKKLAEFTKVQLEKDLQGLLDQIVESKKAAAAARDVINYGNEGRAVKELDELRVKIEELLSIVKGENDIKIAYGKVSTRSYLFSNIINSMKRISVSLDTNYRDIPA
ncbi:hypothetical protein DB313_05010 (plasmid) [Borrelia turcica IST7]|uniref:Uncharacterized protein n=1 Tax=Borrelia turcica IST7 TaxID=1104446 RepID=A0A386PPD5_9SPIR|nr:hypothetical protein [Borrelia turcica]AYE36859.1 hypothetical protein DB313_05010 [Borrelia turcica IST7]